MCEDYKFSRSSMIFRRKIYFFQIAGHSQRSLWMSLLITSTRTQPGT